MATCIDCLHQCYTSEIADVEQTCNFFIDKEQYQLVRHGEWIAKNIGGASTLFICSNCQREIEVCNDYFGKPTKHMSAIYPYCHCGTKMDR